MEKTLTVLSLNCQILSVILIFSSVMADLFQKAEVVVTKVTIEEQSDSKMEIVDITSRSKQ